MADVIAEIRAERERQVGVEGWTIDHDDSHSTGEMALAAAAYCYTASISETEANHLAESIKEHGHGAGTGGRLEDLWPWDPVWLKPRGKRRDLIRAAALIVAEIERLDRAEPTNA